MKHIIRKILNESNEFDWLDTSMSVGALKELLSSGRDIPFLNYNLNHNSPYVMRGTDPTIYYLSTDKYWWDRLGDLPLDDEGRGKGEWFKYGYKDGDVAIIMPDQGGLIDDIRSLDNDDFSAITNDLKRLTPYFNGTRDELHIPILNGKIMWDFVPEHLRDEIKQAYEKYPSTKVMVEGFMDDLKDIRPALPKVNMTVTFCGYEGDEMWDKVIEFIKMVEDTYGYDKIQWAGFTSDRIRNSISKQEGGNSNIVLYVEPKVDGWVRIGWDNCEWDYGYKGNIEYTVDEILDGSIFKQMNEGLSWDVGDVFGDIKPMSITDDYVINLKDVASTRKIEFLFDDLNDLGYSNIDGIPANDVCYIYLEYHADTNEMGDPLRADWDECTKEDPTYGGDYKMINLEDFDTLYPHWRKESKDLFRVNEGTGFEWAEDIPPLPFKGMKIEAPSGNILTVIEVEESTGDDKHNIYVRWYGIDAEDGHKFIGADTYKNVTKYLLSGSWKYIGTEDEPINESFMDILKDIDPNDSFFEFNGHQEVWFDVKGLTEEEKMVLLNKMEQMVKGFNIHQGSVDEPIDAKKHLCVRESHNGILLHCGTDEVGYKTTEGSVCCMSQTYDNIVRENEGYGVEPPIKVDNSIVRQIISQPMNEGFMDVLKDIPEYVFFDIYICNEVLSMDWETGELETEVEDLCPSGGYSVFMKVPIDKISEWTPMSYKIIQGDDIPMSDADEILEYAIENDYIDDTELNYVVYVREIEFDEYVEATQENVFGINEGFMDDLKNIQPIPKIGDRIRLVNMPDDPDPIEPGTEGTVTSVNTMEIRVVWDNGRTLSLLPEVDEWEIIDE